MAGAGVGAAGAGALGAAQLIARLLGPMVGATLGQSLQQVGAAANEQKYRDYDIGQFSRQLKDITQGLRGFGDMVGHVTRSMGISTNEQVQAMRTALKYGDQTGSTQSMRTSTQSAQDSLIFAVSNGINRQLYNSLKDIMGQGGTIGSTNAYAMTSSQFERSFARNAQIGNYGMRTQDYLQGAVAYTQQRSSQGIAAFDPTSFLNMQAQIGLAAQRPGQAYLHQFGQNSLSQMSNAFSQIGTGAAAFPNATNIFSQQASQYRMQETALSKQQDEVRKQLAAASDPLAIRRLGEKDAALGNQLTSIRQRTLEAEGYQQSGPYGLARGMQNANPEVQSKLVMDQVKLWGYHKGGPESAKQFAVTMATQQLNAMGIALTANQVDAITKIDEKAPAVDAQRQKVERITNSTTSANIAVTPGSTLEQIISGEATPDHIRKAERDAAASATFSSKTDWVSQGVGIVASAASPFLDPLASAVSGLGFTGAGKAIENLTARYDLNDAGTRDFIIKQYADAERQKAERAGAPITDAEAFSKANAQYKEEADTVTGKGVTNSLWGRSGRSIQKAAAGVYNFATGSNVTWGQRPDEYQVQDKWKTILSQGIADGENLHVLPADQQDTGWFGSPVGDYKWSPEKAAQVAAVIETSGMIGATDNDAFNAAARKFMQQSGADRSAQEKYLRGLNSYGVSYKDTSTGKIIKEEEFRKRQAAGTAGGIQVIEGSDYTRLRTAAGLKSGETNAKFEEALNTDRIAVVADVARTGQPGDKITTSKGEVLDNNWWNRLTANAGGGYTESTGTFKMENPLEEAAIQTERVAKAMEGLAIVLEPMLTGLRNREIGAANAVANSLPPVSRGSAFGGALSGSMSSIVGERGPELFITGRVFGGPTKRGSAYIVGENGPELFRPSQDGTVLTNSVTKSLINKNYDSFLESLNENRFSNFFTQNEKILRDRFQINEWGVSTKGTSTTSSGSSPALFTVRSPEKAGGGGAGGGGAGGGGAGGASWTGGSGVPGSAGSVRWKDLVDSKTVKRGLDFYDANQSLGAVSAFFESGGRTEAISDAGDYGIYQLSTITGSLNTFINALPDEYKSKFLGLTPGSAQFDSTWKSLKDDQSFRNLQAEHIKGTHYAPYLKNLKNEGYDFTNRGKPVQDLLWAIGTQYGPGFTSIAQRAFSDLNEDQINALSDASVVERIVQSQVQNIDANFIDYIYDRDKDGNPRRSPEEAARRRQALVSRAANQGAIVLDLIDRKASGGTIGQNKPTIVGERGPELLLPGASASILSNTMTNRLVSALGSPNNQTAAANSLKEQKLIVEFVAPDGSSAGSANIVFGQQDQSIKINIGESWRIG